MAMSVKVDLDTTSNTYVLFLDMFEVEALNNLELVVNNAEKHPNNPVLPVGDVGHFDRNGASSWEGSIIFDEDENTFKIWYYGWRGLAIGYAWSKDGVLWNKPQIGLYKYMGNNENNICWQSPTGLKTGHTLGPETPQQASGHFIVAKDYKETDQKKRYKGWTHMYYKNEDRNGYFPIYSPDGIHWTARSKPVSYPTIDPVNLLIDYDDNDPNKRIKVFGVFGNIDSHNIGRSHSEMGYGPNIENCTPSPHNPVINPEEGYEHTIHLFSVIHYKGYYIMLYDPNLWLEYYGYTGGEEGLEIRKRDSRVPDPNKGFFTGDVRLAVNRDGISKFKRVNPHQPVVSRGERGEWDSGFLVMPGAVVHDNKIYVFYTGVNEDVAVTMPQWYEGDEENRPDSIRTGLATLRLDGFTNLQSRNGISPGTVTTIPICVKNPERARLNINASNLKPGRNWIEVEILDASTNQPIECYEKESCNDILREGVKIPVVWGENETFKKIPVSKIKLRFQLYGKAKLYSFTFNP